MVPCFFVCSTSSSYLPAFVLSPTAPASSPLPFTPYPAMDRPVEHDIVEEASIAIDSEKEDNEKDQGDVERIDEVYGKLDANSPKCGTLFLPPWPPLTYAPPPPQIGRAHV